MVLKLVPPWIFVTPEFFDSRSLYLKNLIKIIGFNWSMNCFHEILCCKCWFESWRVIFMSFFFKDVFEPALGSIRVILRLIDLSYTLTNCSALLFRTLIYNHHYSNKNVKNGHFSPSAPHLLRCLSEGFQWSKPIIIIKCWPSTVV